MPASSCCPAYTTARLLRRIPGLHRLHFVPYIRIARSPLRKVAQQPKSWNSPSPARTICWSPASTSIRLRCPVLPRVVPPRHHLPKGSSFDNSRFPRRRISDSRSGWRRSTGCWNRCGSVAPTCRTSGRGRTVVMAWPTSGWRRFRNSSCRARRFWPSAASGAGAGVVELRDAVRDDGDPARQPHPGHAGPGGAGAVACGLRRDHRRGVMQGILTF
jgi:hypothetical protein